MATTTPNYDINYDDERFTDVETERDDALASNQATYGDMLTEADSVYEEAKSNVESWKNAQTEAINQQTEFTVQQIEQDKEEAAKDYEKEQAGAYVDWRKQSNDYGVNAERMASAGLAKTGYSESSQVSMYNTYQNRVATAREAFTRAWTDFENKIAEAKMQNSVALAQIASEAFEKLTALSLEQFQYKNSLISEMTNREMQIKQFYSNEWQNVLSQLNTENVMAENIRQFNENQKFNTEQAELDRQFQGDQAELDRKFESEQAELDRKFESEQAELNRKFEKEMLAAKTEAERSLLAEQHRQAMEKLKKQHEYDKSLLAYQNSLNKTTYGTGPVASNSTQKSTVKSAVLSPGASAKANAFTKGSATNNSSKYFAPKTGEINQQSVLDLGYGPISANRLAELVTQGKVKLVWNASAKQYYASRTGK